MKDKKADDRFHLGNILEAIDAIEARLTLGFSEQVVKEAIVFHLMAIGEAVTKLSRELKQKHPEIPWSDIAGTRHKIVHEYYRIDYDVVENIVYGQLTDLHRQVTTILAELTP